MMQYLIDNNFPVWSHEWLSRRLSKLEEFPENDLLLSIRDWLFWCENNNPKLVTKFYKFTWQQTLDAHLKWHLLMQKKASKKRLDTGDTETILTHKKLTWKRLLSYRELDKESECLNHCIGQGYYDFEIFHNKSAFYSLRDENNISHLTVEHNIKNNSFSQIRSKGNGRIPEKYIEHILKLHKHLNNNTMNFYGIEDGKYANFILFTNEEKNLLLKCNINSKDSILIENLDEKLNNVFQDDKEIHVYGDFLLKAKDNQLKENFIYHNMIHLNCNDIEKLNNAKIFGLCLYEEYKKINNSTMSNLTKLELRGVSCLKFIQGYKNIKHLKIKDTEIQYLKNMNPDTLILNNTDIESIEGCKAKETLEILNCNNLKKIDAQECSEFIKITSHSDIEIPYLKAPFIYLNIPENCIPENIEADTLIIEKINSEHFPKQLKNFKGKIIINNCFNLQKMDAGEYIDKIVLKNFLHLSYINKETKFQVLKYFKDNNSFVLSNLNDISNSKILCDVNFVKHPLIKKELPDFLENTDINGNLIIDNLPMKYLNNIKANSISIKSQIEDIQHLEAEVITIKKSNIKNLHIKNCKKLILIDCEIEKLILDNCENIHIDNTKILQYTGILDLKSSKIDKSSNIPQDLLKLYQEFDDIKNHLEFNMNYV